MLAVKMYSVHKVQCARAAFILISSAPKVILASFTSSKV